MDPFTAFQAPSSAVEKAVGWEAFSDVQFLLDMVTVLLVAIFLSAVIAYHPLTRAKAASIAEIEQPKTFIMYSMVGAVIAQIVRVQPSMALVIFGIGGLLRFRTNVGEAKDTGRVILVTVVGLCCGLGLYVVAVLATVFGWILIYILEVQTVGQLVVKGLEPGNFSRASQEYPRLLTEAGCSIVGGEKNLNKGWMSFVFKAPRGLDKAELERRFAALPENIRGAIDWINS